MIAVEVFQPKRIDERGRCCSTPTMALKRRLRGISSPSVCVRCHSEYGPDGHQRPNWAWIRQGDGFVRNVDRGKL